MSTRAQAPAGERLAYWLRDFQSRFNANPRAAKLAAGWDRHLLVDPTDGGARYTLDVTDARVSDVREGDCGTAGDERLITMSAEEDTLIDIFSGGYNPSTALIDGQLEVYSDSRDKVKLEALAMVIWGL